MPYYVQSAYFPLPGAPRAPASQQQQQQQHAPAPAPIDQVFLQQQQQQQAQAQSLQQAYQQQRQAEQQDQYYAAAQQLQQQQQQRQQQQQYHHQPQQPPQQQYIQREQQQPRSGYQQAPPQAPQFKASEYMPVGGAYSTGAPLAAPLRRAPSRADVYTAIEAPEPYNYQTYGYAYEHPQQQHGYVARYNQDAGYGQAPPRSPLRSQRQSREPSQYANNDLNPAAGYGQQQQHLQRAPSQGSLSESGARSDANNNNYSARQLRARSPARGLPQQLLQQQQQQQLQQLQQQQRNFPAPGALAESAYIGIPNDLVYAQSNQQRAYAYGGQEAQQQQRPAYASSSRTNNNQQSAAPAAELKPAVARQLYAALSSENVRTALERDAPQYTAPVYSSYNGQKVQGRAFVIPAEQKYSEYNMQDLNGLHSVMDHPLR